MRSSPASQTSDLVFIFPSALKQTWTKQALSTFIHESSCSVVETTLLLSRPGPEFSAQSLHNHVPLYEESQHLHLYQGSKWDSHIREFLASCGDQTGTMSMTVVWKLKWNGTLLKDYMSESSMLELCPTAFEVTISYMFSPVG